MRRNVVLESEEEFWSKLSPDYMTEESDDDENPDIIIRRNICWRSKCKSYVILLRTLFEETIIGKCT